MKFNKFCLLIIFFLSGLSSVAEEIKTDNNTEFNIYTGMFDFSDDGKEHL